MSNCCVKELDVCAELPRARNVPIRPQRSVFRVGLLVALQGGDATMVCHNAVDDGVFARRADPCTSDG